jgi:hypothetical protein
MLNRFVPYLIAAASALGIVVSGRYMVSRQPSPDQQHIALHVAARQAEQQACRDWIRTRAYGPRGRLSPGYVVLTGSDPGLWFDNAQFGCEIHDPYRSTPLYYVEIPGCNRARIERQWLRCGKFTASLLADCGITPPL